ETIAKIREEKEKGKTTEKSHSSNPSSSSFLSIFHDYFSPSSSSHSRSLSFFSPLIYLLIHDLISEDLANRLSASNLLSKLIQLFTFYYPCINKLEEENVLQVVRKAMKQQQNTITGKGNEEEDGDIEMKNNVEDEDTVSVPSIL